MTTIAANHLATEQMGTPEIYSFESLGTVTYYTSWSSDLTVGGNLYIAKPIQRSGFKQGNTLDKIGVSIASSILPEFSIYISNTPAPVTIVTISKVVIDDLTETLTLFTGTIQSVSFKDNIANVQCLSYNSVLDKLLPKYINKATCNHRLFDTGCGLAEVDYIVTTTATSVSGNELTAVGIDASGYMFTGGYVRRVSNNDTRMITDQAIDSIKLHIAFYNLIEGEDIKVIPGCDGVRETCYDIYDNYPKFLGMATVPTKNPCIYGA